VSRLCGRCVRAPTLYPCDTMESAEERKNIFNGFRRKPFYYSKRFTAVSLRERRCGRFGRHGEDGLDKSGNWWYTSL
ncbi:MAG: hypothetical protein IJ939_01270, partial [Clostridia bacterium]|nr:hypothetical protein [Clostridia bacterium]